MESADLNGMPYWIDMATAAGFDVSKMGLMEVHTLGGKIIEDEVLRLLCMAKVRSERRKHFWKGLRADILRSMSPAARAEFRERISGVRQFPAPVTT